ncbi:MAG: efflux RND transporter periplasmic adaptor subunit [Armatimonadetes bacterium]|nr:efflux RND transporter periplasmic adaptor subunit [Armatimonadota bacterium]
MSKLNGIGLIVLAATALTVTSCGKEQARATERAVKTVSAEVQTVGQNSDGHFFEASGIVRPLLRAELASKVMARVVRVNVRPGDRVHQGQVLVTLDSRELSSAVNIASANLQASRIAVSNAETAATMEAKTSSAQVKQAEAQVAQAKAALAAANAKLDLVKAGPRTQEKTQARLAVLQAKSSLDLATTELDRTTKLYEKGAVAKRQLDVETNNYNLAKAAYETAVESEKIAQEGSRTEDLRAARESVTAAEGAVRQAEAGLNQARAGTMMVQVRNKEIESARAQTHQTSAALEAAQVSLGYATITAPFDGVVVSRMVDPGALASPGTPLVGIEGGGFRLESPVPETLVDTLAVGDSVSVLIDSAGKEPISATVTELVPEGNNTSHSFLLKSTLPESNQLKSGMFGRVQIPLEGQTSIAIPTQAIWEREGLHHVFVLNPEGIAHLRIISIGSSFGDQTEVLSGLNSEERIVTKGRENVADGDKVEPQR